MQHSTLLVDEHDDFFGSSLLGKQVTIFDVKNVAILVAVSVLPNELYHAPRCWPELEYSKLIHYNRLDKGRHFVAWEPPQIFSE